MVTGVTTEAIAGEKMIVTAGGVDTHVHYICPQLLPEALASGVTTLYGGGSGPASGTCATTCTPAPEHVKMMLQALTPTPTPTPTPAPAPAPALTLSALASALRLLASSFRRASDALSCAASASCSGVGPGSGLQG